MEFDKYLEILEASKAKEDIIARMIYKTPVSTFIEDIFYVAKKDEDFNSAIKNLYGYEISNGNEKINEQRFKRDLRDFKKFDKLKVYMHHAIINNEELLDFFIGK
jgi:hypothetical protein